MSKVLEETWTAKGGFVEVPDEDRDGFFGSKDAWGGSCPCIDLTALEKDEERARISACAPEALRLLLEAEWKGEVMEKEACPWCLAWRDRIEEKSYGGHSTDCRWLALMKKAGLR